jgi:hypothetical protein
VNAIRAMRMRSLIIRTQQRLSALLPRAPLQQVRCCL